MDDLKDAVVNLLVDGAAGQQVLGADELSGLRQDGGAALLDNQVAELADQGVASGSLRRRSFLL